MQCQIPVRTWLQMTANALGPAAFLIEVGTWRGDTAKLLTSGGGRVLCVDTFEGTGLSEPAPSLWEYIHNVAGWRNIVALMAPSLQAASLLPAACADLVFIDATHTYDALAADIRAWRPIVKPGGILCGDDWNLLDVRRAVADTCPKYDPIDEWGWYTTVQ